MSTCEESCIEQGDRVRYRPNNHLSYPSLLCEYVIYSAPDAFVAERDWTVNTQVCVELLLSIYLSSRWPSTRQILTIHHIWYRILYDIRCCCCFCSYRGSWITNRARYLQATSWILPSYSGKIGSVVWSFWHCVKLTKSPIICTRQWSNYPLDK